MNHTILEPVGGDDPQRTESTKKKTFTSYVVGDSNRFAYEAASAVALEPKAAWNPLYLCGPSGVGKTHLLLAIGAQRDQLGDDAYLRVRAEALRGDVHQIRRHASCVLIDDVQDFGSDPHAHGLLAADVEDLIAAGTQLVFAGDQLPRDLFTGAAASRLTSRLEGGLVVAIEPPSPSTRLRIVQELGRAEGVEIDELCADAIGRHAGGSVRTIEGRVSKVLFEANLSGTPLTVQFVHEVLRNEPEFRPAVSIEMVKQRVAQDYHVSVRDIEALGREPAIVQPRHVAMALARELTDASLPTIARAFRRRDHTTVMNACRRIAHLSSVHPDLKDRIHRIRAEILG